MAAQHHLRLDKERLDKELDDLDAAIRLAWEEWRAAPDGEKPAVLHKHDQLVARQTRLDEQRGQLLAGGAGAAEGAMLEDIRAELRYMKLERDRASLTTQWEGDIGKEYMKGSSSLERLPFEQLTEQHIRTIAGVWRQLCERHGAAADSTFEGLVRHAAAGAKLSEPTHMQPIMMELLKDLATQLKSALLPTDTHSSGLQPQSRKGMIDCSLIPINGTKSYAYLVAPIEAKLQHHDLGSGGRPALARLLLTPAAQLGYVAPVEPHGLQVEDVGTLQNFRLLRYGTKVERATLVYSATLQQPGRALDVVVKRGCTPREMQILRLLSQFPSPHWCRLVTTLDRHGWMFTFQGQACSTVVLDPLCKAVEAEDGVGTVAQVALDIASAIHWLLTAPDLPLKILHRDISAGNIAQHQGRGVLLDFSASKMVESVLEKPSEGGTAPQLTGTPTYVALSLLEDLSEPHSLSTHLESLYYSIRHCISSLPDAWVFEDHKSVSKWAAVRRGYMLRPQDIKLPEGADAELAAFLLGLHHLFFPAIDDTYRYRKDVELEEFAAVCLNSGAEQPAQLPAAIVPAAMQTD